MTWEVKSVAWGHVLVERSLEIYFRIIITKAHWFICCYLINNVIVGGKFKFHRSKFWSTSLNIFLLNFNASSFNWHPSERRKLLLNTTAKQSAVELSECSLRSEMMIATAYSQPRLIVPRLSKKIFFSLFEVVCGQRLKSSSQAVEYRSVTFIWQHVIIKLLLSMIFLDTQVAIFLKVLFINQDNFSKRKV